MRWLLEATALGALLLAGATVRADDLKQIPFESLKFHDADNSTTKYQRPPGLEVLLTGVSVEGNAVVAKGVIENRTASSLELVLQLPQVSLLRLRPNAALQLPPPSNAPPIPEVFPWPRVFQIPPKSRVPWSASQSLDGYKWSGSPKVDVDWSVLVWNESNGRGVFGTVSAVLPQHP
jgi:hypothetical protein